MFRKHFRFRRMVLGLAFAALVTPVATATAATITTYQPPSYLRYHEVGGPVGTGPEIRSEHGQAVATVTPLQAEGMRWNAMADTYLRNQPTKAISERSFGVPGPDPSLVPQLASSTSTSSTFDWTDAGIGAASAALIAAALLGIGIVTIRRHQHTGLTSA
jgi:hypothetical protein